MHTFSIGPRVTQRTGDNWWLPLAVFGHEPVGFVDAGGRVAVDGWSIDWAVNTAERWYLAADEPSIRQRRMGPGLVAETSMRVENGDIRQRAYGVIADGHQVLAMEFHNDLSIPVALALAVRPYGLSIDSSGAGAPVPVRLFGVNDEVVSLDGRPRLVLARPPSEMAASLDRDLLADLSTGGADGAVSAEPWPESGEPGTNGMVVVPLPHNASIRILILPDGVEGAGSAERGETGDAARLRAKDVPDSDMVARGWSAVVSAGATFDFPEPGLSEVFASATATVLAHSGELGAGLREFRPGAGLHLLALALTGHRSEVTETVLDLAGAQPGLIGSDRQTYAHAWVVPRRAPYGAQAMADIAVALPYAIAATDIAGKYAPDLAAEFVDGVVGLVRAVKRSKDQATLTQAEQGLAHLVALAGDAEGAQSIMARIKSPAPAQPDSANLDALMQQQSAISPLHTWHQEGVTPVGAAAAFIVAARQTVIDDAALDGEIRLLPHYPSSWRGGNMEVSDAPVRAGALGADVGAHLGFAIRWHGARPALLWESTGSATLGCSSLDPAWRSTDPSGETLLAGAETELPSPAQPGENFQ